MSTWRFQRLIFLLLFCSPLPKRVDVNKYSHLQDLELADRSEIGQDAIDILIGSDYY